MVIDASNPLSFPQEMFDIIRSYISNISESELKKLKETTIEHSGDVRCAIERFIGPNTAFQIYQDELIPVFKRYDLRCFHATRIDSLDTIIREGLFSNTDRYKKFLGEFLFRNNVSNDRKQMALDLIESEIKRKYSDFPHKICFFTNIRSLFDSEGCASYDQFFETVGGELASWALEDKMPEELELLRTQGIPVVVEFKIPFSNVANYDQGGIIYHFVSAIVAKQIWNYDYVVEPDGSLDEDVSPSNIIRVISIDEKAKRLKC